MLHSADGAAGAATDGILLGIEPGIVDNTSDGTVKLVHLMVLQMMVNCLVSSLVQQMVVQMMVLCLAWSSVQTMELQMVPCYAMLLLLYYLVGLMVLLLMAYCLASNLAYLQSSITALFMF